MGNCLQSSESRQQPQQLASVMTNTTSVKSERGFKINDQCEIYGTDDKWHKGHVTKIFNHANSVWITILVNHEAGSYHEWSRNVIKIHDEHHRELDTKQERNGCNGVVAKCHCTKRMLQALEFYQQLNLHSHTDQQRCISYFKNTYTQLMNDWTHFMSKHNDMIELEQLFEDNIINNYHLNPCHSMNCLFAIRHHRDRRCKNDAQSNIDKNRVNIDDIDIEYLFYQDIMDGIHCYIYHLYDFGMRVSKIHDGDFTQICEEMQRKISNLQQMKQLNLSRYTTNKFEMFTPAEQGITTSLLVSTAHCTAKNWLKSHRA